MALAELLAFGVLMLPYCPHTPIFGRIKRDLSPQPEVDAANVGAAYDAPSKDRSHQPGGNGNGSPSGNGNSNGNPSGNGNASAISAAGLRSLEMSADALRRVPAALVSLCSRAV